MKLFMDTDIIIKLSVYQLLDEVPSAFGCKRDDIRVLYTARFQIKSSKKIRENYPPAAVLRAKSLIDSCASVLDPPKAIRERLETIENIDAGEAILFGSAQSAKDTLILTDDKKSIRALHFSSPCSDICDRLQGRIYTLSLVILRLVEHHGYPHIQSKIKIDPSGEEHINAVFSRTPKPSQSLVENALKADLVKLRSKSGGLLGAF